jgi:isoquinoline 1-oxidoreductase subunit beta
VLELAAEQAGWGQGQPKGRGLGIAVHESFDTFVAQVADVTTDLNGGFKVEKVVCAVDCGIAINPDVIVAPMEGSIGYALGTALRDKITLTDGEVDESKFNDYEPLRMNDMPKIEVHIVESGASPTDRGGAWANLACPRSRRRSPTPSSLRPEGGCDRCHSLILL